MTDSSLDLINLSIFQGENIFFKDFSLKVNQGDWIEIIGRNNSGKSLLINSIYGLYKDYKGDIKLDGINSSLINESERKKNFGIYSSAIPLLEDKTIRANLSLAFNIHGTVMDHENNAYLNKILSQFGLVDKLTMRCDLLSDSEKTLVLIVRAMMTEPKILLLDCPFRNLDLIHTRKCVDLFKEFISIKNRSLILCTDLVTDYAADQRSLFILESGQLKSVKS